MRTETISPLHCTTSTASTKNDVIEQKLPDYFVDEGKQKFGDIRAGMSLYKDTYQNLSRIGELFMTQIAASLLMLKIGFF